MNFRVARHADNLARLTEFYCTVLNFEKLDSFENHDSYDGVFVGKPKLDWHLEFTSSATKANHHFDEDDILVFYPATQKEYRQLIENMDKYGIDKEEPPTPIGEIMG